MQIGYVALRKSKPNLGQRSQILAHNPKLESLHEVVSLDAMLCPSVIESLIDSDWEHKVYELISHDFFSDHTYLKARLKNESEYQILAILPDPTPHDVTQFKDIDFEFLGYELIDVETMTDPILNCSTFKDLIPYDCLTSTGLIADYERGRELQKTLVDRFPNSSHSDAMLFAIWRKREFTHS